MDNTTNLPDDFILNHIESVHNARYKRLQLFKKFCESIDKPIKLKRALKAFSKFSG